MSDDPTPDGIGRRHIHDSQGSRFHRWPVGVIVLGALLAAATGGVFGSYDLVEATDDGATLSLDAPARIRTGELFEMTFTIRANRQMRDAVLVIDERIWRDMTINTVMPEPVEQAFRNGAFELHFGPLAAVTPLLVKIDGQVNPHYPPRSNDGLVRLADGEAPLVTIDYAMKVLP